MIALARLLLLWLCLVGSADAFAEDLLAVPPLTRHVVDQAGILQAEQIEALDQRLIQFEQAHGSQIAVLIVPTTRPEAIEQYSIRVFETWKLGRSKTNDGILILVAAQDRKLRIDTGYGLEGVIPDAIAKRIVAEIIVPKFRAGETYAGLLAGVVQIEKLIVGEQLPPPFPSQRHEVQGSHGSQGTDDSFSQMLVVGIVAATIVGGVLSSILGRLFGSLATAGVVGAIAWFMSGSLLAVTAAGVIVFLYVLLTGGRGGSSFGGWGGGTGGWGSGGGSSSGGWGGGGGGAGGGGASGEW